MQYADNVTRFAGQQARFQGDKRDRMRGAYHRARRGARLRQQA